MKVENNGSEEHGKVLEFIKSKFIEWGMSDHIKD